MLRTSGESSLDRVYANFHVAHQLDHQIRSHRPVAFSYSPPGEHGGGSMQAYPEWICKEPEFPRRTAELYQHWLDQEPVRHRSNGLRLYVLLQRAKASVAKRLLWERGNR